MGTRRDIENEYSDPLTLVYDQLATCNKAMCVLVRLHKIDRIVSVSMSGKDLGKKHLPLQTVPQTP